MIAPVQLAQPRGNEAGIRKVRTELVVEVTNDRQQILTHPNRHPQHRPDLGHAKRGADPMPGRIGQEEHCPIGAVSQTSASTTGPCVLVPDDVERVTDHIVRIAAGLVRRLAPGVDLVSAQDRQTIGEGALLNLPRKLNVALELHQ